MYQTMLYTLNVYSVICQLYLNKIRQKGEMEGQIGEAGHVLSARLTRSLHRHPLAMLTFFSGWPWPN